MRVLVFESTYIGHSLTFLRLLLPALREVTDDVVVALPADAGQSVQFKVQLGALEDCCRFDAWYPSPEGSPLQRARQRARFLSDSVKRSQPDHVLVPQADGVAQVLGAYQLACMGWLPRGLETEGLLLRGAWAYQRPGWKRRLGDRASWLLSQAGPWSTLHWLDPIAYEQAARESAGRPGRRMGLMPDPVELPPNTDRIAARRLLGIPEDGRYVGSVGASEGRKGIDRLIHAFAAAPLRPDDRLLLVGRLLGNIPALLEGPYAELVRARRIIAINRYVTEEELLAGVTALDMVCTPYPEHIGSASIVIRAAASGRPVLASTYGWMGHVVPRFELGWTFDPANPNALGQALAETLDRAPAYHLSAAGQRFVRFHSVENFRAAWTDRLRERLGLPSSRHRLSWRWALGEEHDTQAALQ